MDLKSMAHAVEAASKYSYDSVADQWHRETVWVRIDDEPFAMVMMLRADVGDNLRPCVAWIPDTVHVDPDRANREPRHSQVLLVESPMINRS